MNIDIYTNYKIRYKNTGFAIDEENSLPNGVMFRNINYDKTFIENGGNLINRIAKYMLDDECQEIKIENNRVIIEFFNPFFGESNTIELEIEK